MIRLATINDIKSIINLGKYLNSNFEKTYDIESYLSDEKYIVLVNEGLLINAFLLIFHNLDCYELEAIAVHEDYRHQGLADDLLKYFIKNYQKQKPIILEVAINNTNAINLYYKNGFEKIGERKRYYNGIDAVIMKRVVK